MASIPGMGIPEQLKAAMEQEQSSKYGVRRFFQRHQQRGRSTVACCRVRQL